MKARLNEEGRKGLTDGRTESMHSLYEGKLQINPHSSSVPLMCGVRMCSGHRLQSRLDSELYDVSQ